MQQMWLCGNAVGRLKFASQPAVNVKGVSAPLPSASKLYEVYHHQSSFLTEENYAQSPAAAPFILA